MRRSDGNGDLRCAARVLIAIRTQSGPSKLRVFMRAGGVLCVACPALLRLLRAGSASGGCFAEAGDSTAPP
jgi:hypothetical protein